MQHNGWVAPFTGAWIETIEHGRPVTYLKSHPLRVRGLKQLFRTGKDDTDIVAPFTGAWIETCP